MGFEPIWRTSRWRGSVTGLNIFFENESSGSDAAAFLAPDNPKAGAIVVLEGVVVNGDVQYRVQGVSAAVIPSFYLNGGGAATTVGDVASNVTFTAGQMQGQGARVLSSDDSVYTFRPPGKFWTTQHHQPAIKCRR